jgi:ketoreductase RED2
MGFSEKVVLVTGSSSGIGEEIARQFAAHGAYVIVNSARSADAGRALAAELPNASYIQADIADEASARALVSDAVGLHGRLDVLVNNAGITEVIDHRDLQAATLDVWRRIFDVNVFGTWSVTTAAIDALRATSGSVVNVSSVAGLRPTGSSIPYAASKAALNHMTVLLAKVVGPEVRVNAVAPGLVETPWWSVGFDDIDALVSAITPLRRSGQPADVAEIVLALAASSYVTGQVVAIDGGLTIVS